MKKKTGRLQYKPKEATAKEKLCKRINEALAAYSSETEEAIGEIQFECSAALDANGKPVAFAYWNIQAFPCYPHKEKSSLADDLLKVISLHKCKGVDFSFRSKDIQSPLEFIGGCSVQNINKNAFELREYC